MISPLHLRIVLFTVQTTHKMLFPMGMWQLKSRQSRLVISYLVTRRTTLDVRWRHFWWRAWLTQTKHRSSWLNQPPFFSLIYKIQGLPFLKWVLCFFNYHIRLVLIYCRYKSVGAELYHRYHTALIQKLYCPSILLCTHHRAYRVKGPNARCRPQCAPYLYYVDSCFLK